MAYRPTKSKYKGKTQIFWITYTTPHQYRGGATHKRTYAKRVYISGRNPRFSKTVKSYQNRLGNRTKGVKVQYENPVQGYTANLEAKRYNQERAKVGRKSVTVTKVVPVDAKPGTRVKVSKTKPKSAMAVA